METVKLACVDWAISGQALFWGAGLLGIALAIPGRGRWIAVARNTLILTGGVCIAVSTTPLSLWFYVAWTVAVVAWCVANATMSRHAWIMRVIATVFCVAGVLLEAPWHVAPSVPLPAGHTVYVLGDSLSAGLDPVSRPPWPVRLTRRHDVTVMNLSVAGATTESIGRQARLIPPEPAVIIIEIGGNDLLGTTSADDFETHLAALLETLCWPGRTVVMFELPLPPGRHAFGEIQRRLARKHGVRLIPKRILAAVMTAPGGTIDSIHLSDTGHDQLAQDVWRLFEPE